MLHGNVTELGARKDRFEVGAVAGDMLYLTSFQSPLYGALLAINLLKDEEPKVCSAEPATVFFACPVPRALQDQACLGTLSAIVPFAYLVPGNIPNVILSEKPVVCPQHRRQGLSNRCCIEPCSLHHAYVLVM